MHYAFFNFAKHYLVDHHPDRKTFEVDDTVMQEFRKFLDRREDSLHPTGIADKLPWLRSYIKSEIFIDAFGQDEGLKVRAEADPEVVKGPGTDAPGQATCRQRPPHRCRALRHSFHESVNSEKRAAYLERGKLLGRSAVSAFLRVLRGIPLRSRRLKAFR